MPRRTTLDLDGLLDRDLMGCKIAEKWVQWNMLRASKKSAWDEVRRYVYATDTTTTSNNDLPWKNKTTVPKLCQIRDNLHANYLAALFPKRKWLFWMGDNKKADKKAKKKAIENYMMSAIERPEFRAEIAKLVQDYIDYGNCFVMPEWEDGEIIGPDKDQVGYVGPVPRRISPLDIVFNPTSVTFKEAPKIVREIITIGDLKRYLEQNTTDSNRESMQMLWDYLIQQRSNATKYVGDLHEKDAYMCVDGFTDYASYLESDYVELLTFYGDMYDHENDKLYQNHIIVVADRHKLINVYPNPSLFGHTSIYSASWRPRQDNLWGMGPLDNLVGMQYRIDHIENMKADIFDLTVAPPLKIKGYVEDFTYGPFEKIICGDDGDVELMGPDVKVLQANLEIDQITLKMEEMAGAPKEAMGFRTPGEKTAYEVQRIENAYSRIFQSKIRQFEEDILEPLLNAMLELARRNVTSTEIRAYDPENKVAMFKTINKDDLVGPGRIRPLAARHFAEKAEMVQNLNEFFNSAMGQDPEIKLHFSAIQLSRVIEEMLNLEDQQVVQPYVRIAERADAARYTQAAQEQVMMETQEPSGLTADDVDTQQQAATEPTVGY